MYSLSVLLVHTIVRHSLSWWQGERECVCVCGGGGFRETRKVELENTNQLTSVVQARHRRREERERESYGGERVYGGERDGGGRERERERGITERQVELENINQLTHQMLFRWWRGAEKPNFVCRLNGEHVGSISRAPWTSMSQRWFDLIHMFTCSAPVKGHPKSPMKPSPSCFMLIRYCVVIVYCVIHTHHIITSSRHHSSIMSHTHVDIVRFEQKTSREITEDSWRCICYSCSIAHLKHCMYSTV